jgi:VanZ family protein
MPFRTIAKFWFPVLLWMGFIFWMSTGMFSAINTFHFFESFLRSFDPEITSRTIRLINNTIRKIGHVTEYFVSGLLVFRAFRAGSAQPHLLQWAFRSVVFIVLLSISDEYHQSFVASRTASFLDVGLDTIGGLLAITYNVIRLRRKAS